MSKVVPFREGIVPAGEPDDELIAEIERLLARAKRGEITGIAWACTEASGGVGQGWNGAEGTLFSLSAAVMTLQHRYGAHLLSLSEPAPEEEGA